MSDIITVLTEMLIKAKDELIKAANPMAVSLAETKVKNLELRLDRILTLADL
jgi:hypothetical protein